MEKICKGQESFSYGVHFQNYCKLQVLPSKFWELFQKIFWWILLFFLGLLKVAALLPKYTLTVAFVEPSKVSEYLAYENNEEDPLHRSSHQTCSITGQACNFIKKETLIQVFSWEFCEISKNNFFIEHFHTTASYYNQFSRGAFRKYPCWSPAFKSKRQQRYWNRTPILS